MARLNRNDWLLGAFELLAGGSISDVRVEPLARQLGVTKGSFYHHFTDRPDLLEALLEAWVVADTERIIAMVDAASEADADPTNALRRLCALTIGTVTKFDGVEQAVREWAAVDEAAAQRCAEVDQRRLDYVAGLLVSAGVDQELATQRSHLLYRVIIGEYTWRRHGGEALNIDSVEELLDLLLSPG